ncbi:MAG TPA: HupE/UreJ family protein, partial [Polyangia bacterium]|nr:HupE/UreJ family protein [Polyangia bacterium]
IALSVAYVGFKNLLPGAARAPYATYKRWLLVFTFGLVHGLGFASVLREIGLPRRGLALALVSFNVGVELGQLLVVGLALPLLVAAARRDAAWYERWGLRAASAVVAAAALVAFFSRLPR